MLIENKTCAICDNEVWENLDHLRDQKYWYRNDFREESEPVGFKICKVCGFVTYDYVSEIRLKESYDRQRPVMQPANIIACNRKNEYHKFMLKTIPLNKVYNGILDIGCAQGAFLDLCSRVLHVNKDILYGTESSKAFAKFARNHYCLKNITEEIDCTKKYDIISMYHVFEHIQYPDKMLKKCRELLTDDGYLYVSIPHYFDRLEDSTGLMIEDFENLFHLNHVNVFNLQAAENIFSKNGLEIIFFDDKMYGYTFLLKKARPDLKKVIIFDDYKDIIKKIENYKKAIDLYQKHDYINAIEIEKTYVDAYVMLALTSQNMKDFEAQKNIFDRALDVPELNSNVKLLNQYARLYYQFDENKPEKQFYSNNIKKAENIFEYLLTIKPGNEDIHYFLAMIKGKYKKQYSSAIYHLNKFLSINPMKFNEAYSLMSYFYSEMD